MEESAPKPAKTNAVRAKFRVLGVLEAAAVLTCICTVTAFFDVGWLLELTSHFRPQYAALLLIAAVDSSIRRKFKHTLAFAGFALINIAVLMPWFVGRQAGAPGGTPFRVLVLNVNTANTHHESVRAEIRRLDPDVVLVMEVDNLWLEELRELRTTWPHSVTSPRPDNFGIALFSKHELRGARAEEIGEAEVPTIVAEIEVGGRAILLLGTHPLAPGRPANAQLRDEQLRLLASRISTSENPVILMGDLNVTPWSPRFRELERASRLRDTMRGFGLQPTWPAPVAFAGIPLDHCLVTPHFAVKRRERARHVGSDHLGVVVDLVFVTEPSAGLTR